MNHNEYVAALIDNLWAYAEQEFGDRLELLERSHRDERRPPKIKKDERRGAVPAKKRHQHFASMRSSQALGAPTPKSGAKPKGREFDSRMALAYLAAWIGAYAECPLMAISRHPDGHAGTSALPPIADIRTRKNGSDSKGGH